MKKIVFLFCLCAGEVSRAQGVFVSKFFDVAAGRNAEDLGNITNASTFEVASFGNRSLNIVVTSDLSGVKSMSFSFDGSSFRNENTAPYTVLKDEGVGHEAVKTPGTHTIVSRAYSQSSGKGRLLGENRISYVVSAGPDLSAPQIKSRTVSRSLVATIAFDEACRANLSYSPKGANQWRTIHSSEMKEKHSFTLTGAQESGWEYRVSAIDVAGNEMQSEAFEIIIPRSVFPGDTWARSSPEEQGLTSASIKEALAYMKKNIGSDVNNTAIVVNGYLVHAGSASTKNVWAASATKSFTSTVLGILIDDGAVRLNDLASNYVSELKAKYSKIELRHFATMTSGYDAVGGGYGWNGQDGSGTPFSPASPSFAPGSHFAYWDDAMNQFGNTLSQAIKQNFSNVFKQRVGSKIGMKNYTWDASWKYRGMAISSGAGSSAGPIRAGAQDMARFGLLFLNRGNWNGEQLVSEQWVSEATRVQVPASLPVSERTQGWIGVGTYGYNWWVNGILPNGKRLWPALPPTAFAARGTNGNMCVIVPDWNLVFVRMGSGGSNSHSVINGTLKILGEGRR